MSTTDFYDDDLVKHRGALRKTRGEGLAEPGATEAPGRPVSELNLTRMARQKEHMEESMAAAAQELERLRQRQENLEKEKHVLEDLRRRQSEYERGKREILDLLNKSLISLEKEELKTEKLLEMVTSTRQRCRSWLAELDSMDEELWPEDQFRDELGKALTKIEDVRIEYNKAVAKIEAHGADDRTSVALPHVGSYEEGTGDQPEKGFMYWLKVGLAVSLPVIITLIILWVLYYLNSLGLL